jgi:calcineurin-like phosphoesterase family protein
MIIENYKKVVQKRDTVWFHGDIIFDPKYLEIVKDLQGNKKLLLGNHDIEKKRNITLSDLLLVFDSVESLVKHKGTWLSHAPIHPDELRGAINIHGHTHYYNIDDDRYINVSVEQTQYAPIPREYLLRNNAHFQRFLENRKHKKR